MKILYIITRSDLGGAQSVVINLANNLVSTNDVIVAAGNGDNQMWYLLNKKIIRVSITSLKQEISFIHDLLTMFNLFKLYFRFKPDVIHLHSSKVGVLGRLVFPNTKIVYTVHGFDSIRIAYRKYLPIERALQNKCSIIVGVSEYDKINLINEGVNNNINVVYNGVSIPELLNYYPFKHIKGYKKIVLCIARLSPQKNLDLFLEIAALLPQYAFVWIGNQYEVVRKYSSNVFFMGSLPNAGAYNEFADLFILPSNYEGLPITIIEAMSLKKPVVASNVGGINEIVINGENGYVVDNNPELFVEKIRLILEDETFYKILSRNALKYYQENLTVDRMVDGYIKIYDKIKKRIDNIK